MTDVFKALFSFWSSFVIDGKPVPAYEAGSVPDGAALPYITYELRAGSSFAASNAAAIMWSGSTETESGFTSFMAHFCDAVREAIPEAGEKIAVPGGFITLYRSTGDFISIMQDAEETAAPGRVLGVRVGYEAHFLTM